MTALFGQLKTELRDHMVSTVDLMARGAGVGWETIVVARRGKAWDWSGVEMRHHRTELEARAGHARMVKKFSELEG